LPSSEENADHVEQRRVGQGQVSAVQEFLDDVVSGYDDPRTGLSKAAATAQECFLWGVGAVLRPLQDVFIERRIYGHSRTRPLIDAGGFCLHGLWYQSANTEALQTQGIVVKPQSRSIRGLVARDYALWGLVIRLAGIALAEALSTTQTARRN
jgi:hypothetical protein